MEDAARRALAAYFRTAGDDGSIVDQPDGSPDIAEWDGKKYVVLYNVRGTLAVYRVRTSGALKRLRRWPAQVARE